MTFRENAMAVLHYGAYEKFPVVSFGYWGETVQKWANEGHITREEADDYCRRGDNGWGDRSIMKKLGFDFNWNSCVGSSSDLFPAFEEKTLEERPDGSRVIRDGSGLIVLVKPGIVSIPAEIGTSLTDRSVWEQEYLPRLRFSMERIPTELLETLRDDAGREIPVGIHCGSLMGRMRELRGVGGMNKTVFSRDRAAVDAEIERLRPLIELGGYIPCPDHRNAPDAKYENVQYYCDRMQNLKL